MTKVMPSICTQPWMHPEPFGPPSLNTQRAQSQAGSMLLEYFNPFSSMAEHGYAKAVNRSIV